MRKIRDRTPPPALTAGSLDALALRYVARFATSRHKLEKYLQRKLTERGWDDDASPLDAVTRVADRMVDLNYIDDAAFAVMRCGAMQRRGLGARRIAQTLHFDGIATDTSAPVLDAARGQAAEAALAFARRKRMGPFAREAVTDPKQRQSQLAAFVRAGHDMRLARAILTLPPGTEVSATQFAED